MSCRRSPRFTLTSKGPFNYMTEPLRTFSNFTSLSCPVSFLKFFNLQIVFEFSKSSKFSNYQCMPPSEWHTASKWFSPFSLYPIFAEAGDPYFGTDFGFDFGPWFVRFRYGFGPWFVRLRSVVRTVSVRFRSVVRTVSVRCSYGFGPWFVRFRSVVLTVSVRFRSVVRTAWYGFVPWFVRLGTVSFRGSEDFGAFSFRDY